MINLDLEKQDKLIDEIITLEMLTYSIFWERERTQQALKEIKEEVEKGTKILTSLLDSEGEEQFKKLLCNLNEMSTIESENSFNNGVRNGLTSLSFLKDYFSTF
jgi:hypothetical protein